MKNYLFLAALIAMLSGCATTVATTGSQLSPGGISDEGTMKQQKEFRDLPAEMQESVLYGA